MTDRELLEMAAKAAGVPVCWSDDGTIQKRPVLVTKAGGGMGTMPYEAEWNPLRDDDAALRLAVKLRISMIMSARSTLAADSTDENEGVRERYASDEEAAAATRRAIVRAAAAMGAKQ